MRRLMLGSLTTALLLTLAGCGDDPAATPAAPTSSPTPAASSATGDASSDAGATASADASETAETAVPSVAPATGPVVTGPTVSVNAPVEAGDSPTLRPDGGTVFNIDDLRYSFELSDVSSSGAPQSADSLARSALRSPTITGAPLDRKPDAEIAGQPAYHVAGPDLRFDGWHEEFGFWYAGNTVIIAVNTPRDVPQEERDAINASVLASVQLLR